MTEEIRVTHDNNTGRWVLPFRATWSPDGKDILCGSMNRGIDVVRADDGKLSRLDSDLQTAICSRMCCHTDLPVLAAASNSGRVHLYCPL